MFNEAPIARCLRLAFTGGVAGLALAATPVFAQTSDESQPQKVERVEVTGSSIKRIEGETGLPVQVITRKDIERTGAVNTEDLLRSLTAAAGTGSLQVSSAAGATTSAVSTLSLRGLGGPRTLILIDGRRTSIYGGAPGGGGDTSVDVNSIPIAAIERIEILKDGASAIYGSDAVAGVVNFILRKDYTGGEVTIAYGDSQHGGAADAKTNAIVGFGDLENDRFNVTIAAGYEHQDPLYGAQRSFANSSITPNQADTTSGNTFPANVAYDTANGAYTAATNPAFPNCAPSVHDTNFDPETVCRFDPGGLVALVPKEDRYNALLNGRFQLTPNVQLFGSFMYNENQTTTQIQPVPLSDEFAIPVTNPYNAYLTNLTNNYVALGEMTAAQQAALIGTILPPHSAGNPSGVPIGNSPSAAILVPPTASFYPTAFAASIGEAGDPLNVRYRSFISGPRVIEDDADTYRALAGVKFSLGSWDFESGLLYNESDVKEKVISGFPEYSLLLPLFDTGVVNPFGATPNAGAIAAETGFTGEAFNSTTKSTSLDFKGTGDIYKIWAGEVSGAFGAEVRREQYDFESSPVIQTGDVSGYGGNFLPVSASRNVESFYAEVNIPIIKHLDLDLAGRYDNYENVGNTTNPKASIRWQPIEQLLLRASVGTGFRAPALTDLFSPQTQSVTVAGLSDPLRCPITHSTLDCDAQFTTLNGGNSHLTPEKSSTSTYGFVLEPTKDISVAVDWWDIELRNTIALGGLDPGTVILVNAASAQEYSYLINRGPSVNGIPGPIISIDQTNINLGRAHLDGIDIDGKWRIFDIAGNRLTFNFSGTYLARYDVQNLDGSYSGEVGQATGALIAGGVAPRWKHQAALTYETGPWSATITNEFQSQYHDIPGNITGLPRDAGPYELYDIQGTYTGFKNLSLTFGIRNLLDRDPPYANAEINGQFQGGYDISYANPIGRFFYGSATYKFK